MEFFFQLLLLSALNLHTVEWNSPFESVQKSNFISLFIIVVLFSGLVTFIIIYFCSPRDQRIRKFNKRCSTLLKGTRVKRHRQKNSVLFVPVLFFMRRILFILIVILMRQYFWVQLASINFVALSAVIFIMWARPLETREANISETFNDCTLLVMSYHMWCFTDIIREPETRNNLGFSFICISLGNISVHMTSMLLSSLARAKIACKRRRLTMEARKKAAS